MRTSHRAFSVLALLVLAGCPGGGGALGDVCSDTGDCGGALQCLASSCVPRCQRGPDCGDGFGCDQSGICRAAAGQPGDTCTSETACTAGLSCQLDGTATDGAGELLAACTAQNAGRPAGATCAADAECRDGTCALGRCVDLCADTRDCPITATCNRIPRVDATNRMVAGTFHGCLPAQGSITWTLPIAAPSVASLLLPVPSGATALSVLFSADDRNQLVGATRVVAPDGSTQFTLCRTGDCAAAFYASPLRHQPGFGESVLAIPSSPSAPLQHGVYTLDVSSLRSDLAPGSAIPKLTVVAKLDASVVLDLHFHFLDLTDHPCASALGVGPLAAASAPNAAFFKDDFLGELKGIFAHGGIALGTQTYDDITNHPDLDGLDVADASSLLALGAYATGVNVFFVRTLSPVGLEAFGPNPGPGGLGGTPKSGVVIGMDTLCYRTWTQVARLTAHEIARYMGLYHNVEPAVMPGVAPYRDPIADTDDSSGNLMFYSEFGGVDLSEGQREILAKSAVLR